MAAESEIQVRDYQLELVEYVTRRNAIIYLPTGAGKTYVAILTLKRFSHHLQESIKNGGKRSIFMCNTVELARQQAAAIKNLTNLKVGFYVGEREVDNWHRSKWEEEIDENQVLVGTVQIFLNLLTQNYLGLSDLSVVIIDECHHGTGQHAMHEFMRLFQLADQNKLPRVIGLTGVLLKGNETVDLVEKRLKELEVTYRGNIITISDSEKLKNVMLYSTQPKEALVVYNSSPHKFSIVDEIKAQIAAYFKLIEHMQIGNIPPKMSKGLATLREPNKKSFIKNLFNDFLYQMEDGGLYMASFAVVSMMIEFEIKMKQSETIALRRMYRSAISLGQKIRHDLMNKFRDMLDEINVPDNECHTNDIIMNFSSPKLRNLLILLKTTFSGKKPEDIHCLIFVERRHTAKCLFGVIKKFIDNTPDLQKVLEPQFMVGRNNLSMNFEGLLDVMWNTSAIKQFREGTCNLIVCSNVLEEGIDFQACNYVIAFDPLKTFNSYVQSKGRARSKDSVYTMFIPDLNKNKLIKQLTLYKEIHIKIRSYLEKRVLERCDPLHSDIKDHFTDILEPFKTKSGSTLLPSSALALVHRYSQVLPTDAFGIVLPWLKLLTDDEKKRLNPFYVNKTIVSLTMPLTSKLKEKIYSDPMNSPRDAKISVAFKTCIKLYELGELNEKLLPKTLQEHLANVSKEHFGHWDKFNDKVTAKEKSTSNRTFKSQCPEELYDTLPRIGEVCYAYPMSYAPIFEETEYSKHMYQGLVAKNTYALLLRKRLPRLAEMPLFTNQGQLSVMIATDPIEVHITSADDLKKLQMYHIMIFRDLLQIWHSYYVMDKRSMENSYLIVPISEAKQINWDLVSQFQRLSQPRPLTTVERSMHNYRPEDYNGKVITQWYANFDHKRFVVTKVRTDLTPRSPMNGTSGCTFDEFTISKYGQSIKDIVHENQFLLEVRELTTRVNFFINAKGKSDPVQKYRSKVILIPELCHNFKYPADMWLKALFLPCILHRLKFMLHAEHIRVRINKFLKLDSNPRNTTEYYPKPLLIDQSLRRNFDDVGNVITDKEFDEPKSLLQPLPTKEIEESLEKMSLSDFNAPWQTYMAPKDFNRHLMNAYPVELNYYHAFTSGRFSKVEDVVKQYESLWTKPQFQKSTHVSYGNIRNSNGKKLPMICGDSPYLLNKKNSSIKILERSLAPTEQTTAEQSEFMAALTTASASDVFDMERFELLGDSFLKFSVSLYLANKYPFWNEGELTTIKSKMVSNRNLLYLLHDTDIPERISKTFFHPKFSWLPPCASLPYNVLKLWETDPELAKLIGVHNLHELSLTEQEVTEIGTCDAKQYDTFINGCKQNAKSVYVNYNFDSELNTFVHREQLPDKIIADTLEAILGVCVNNYDIHKCFRMLEFFGIVKPDANQPLTHLLDLKLASVAFRTDISARDVDCFLTNYKHLEHNLGYTFRDRAYLLQALTHPSFPTNRITGCYQELEFIGDAILDFLVSAYIFERQTHMNPGQLTDLRSALVNNTTLGCICIRSRFHLFILAENSVLVESIKNFAEFQETQGHIITNLVRILLEEEDAIKLPQSLLRHSTPDGTTKVFCNMSTNVDVPKALGDVLEALIAAVYLDSRDLKRTWEVIYSLFEPELIAFSNNIPINAIRQLNDHKYAKPKYSDTVIEDNIAMVSCEFTCLDKTVTVHGFGPNGKQAKLSAAKHALQKLAKCEAK